MNYLPEEGLAGFDLVLSYTGGAALTELRTQLGARRVAPLYGSADPSEHRPVPSVAGYRADLSYLGMYAADRQVALERLFLEPARRFPQRRFVLGGAQYPESFPWSPNIFFVQHLPPAEHPAFFCSSRLTLNVTRGAMAELGYCPSGRLFEAAACRRAAAERQLGGAGGFLHPGRELLLAETTAEAMAAMELSDAELAAIGRAARDRVLAEHTAAHRARELEELFQGACQEPALA